MGMIKAVFFDFDGTLVDYDSVLGRACEMAALTLKNILRGKGIEVSYNILLDLVFSVERRYAKTTLVDRNEWWKIILRELNIPTTLSSEELNRVTLAYWSEIMKAKPFSNVEYTLKYLKSKGYKLGIITNTDGLHSMKRTRIKRSGLMGYFDLVIVAGEDTEKQKPDPEPFLKAVKEFNLTPSECVMVGDTLSSDIEGAKRVGLITVYIRRGRLRTDSESIADYVIDDIVELTRLL
ncbi:MAG TPA: HAD family hydrolase [Desulfurococcales archaeon]|nr:HAD family hydrolase [Desulfurococcales archaeon]